MGALWASAPWPHEHQNNADIRESASVAHIYGQKFVAAESLTAFGNTFAFTPETLKPHADRELAMGLNRFVIHTSVHQPDDRPGPGVTLGPFGQWFTRHETWAGEAKPWISYLTRSSFLLQQGRFVADIAYLYGEGDNVTNLFGGGPPPIPAGLQLRLREFGCAAKRLRRQGWKTDDTLGYAVSRPRARCQHSTDVAAATQEDSGSRRCRCDGGRRPARKFTEPHRRCQRIRIYSESPLGSDDRRTRRPQG